MLFALFPMQQKIRNKYLFEINPLPSLIRFMNIINQSMPALQRIKNKWVKAYVSPSLLIKGVSGVDVVYLSVLHR